MSPRTAAYADTQPLRILVEPRVRVRRGAGGARAVSSILLAGVVLAIVAATAGVMLGAWRFTVIDTGSMRPTLDPGDVAILTSEPTIALRRGQIVAFHPPGEPRVTVMHRVVSIERRGGALTIRTKGDANDAIDPWHARLLGGPVWREDLKVPVVGYLAVWSQQPPVRFGVLGAIVILTASILLGLIWEPNGAGRDVGERYVGER